MTVTLSRANSSRTATPEMVLLGQEVSTLTTEAAIAGPQQSFLQQRLRQRTEELLRACFNTGRLDPANVINTMSSYFTAAWLAKNAPTVATYQTEVNAGVTSAGASLRAAQIQAVEDAVAQGIVSGTSVMATMS